MIYNVLALLFAISSPFFILARSKTIGLVYFIFSGIIFSFVSGLRVNVGTDYLNYVNIYNNILADNIYNRALEFSFYHLAYNLKSYGYSYLALFMVMSFLNVFTNLVGIKLILSMFIKDSRSYVYSVWIFLLTGAFFLSLNGIRQSTAIGLSLILVYFLINKNIVKSFCFSLFSVSFHWFSGVVVITSVFLSSFRKYLLIISVLVLPITFFLGKSGLILSLVDFILSFLPEKYNYAMEHLAKYRGGLSAKLIFENLIFIVSIVFVLYRDNKLALVTDKSKMISILGYFSLIAISLNNLGLGVVLILRLAYYFQLFIPLFLLCVATSYFKEGISRNVIVGVIFLFYTLAFLRMNTSNVHEVNPYISWL